MDIWQGLGGGNVVIKIVLSKIIRIHFPKHSQTLSGNIAWEPSEN